MNNVSLPERWIKFDEELVLQELIGVSQEFTAYYKARRDKITQRLVWVRDDNLPEGIDFRVSRMTNGDAVIRLREIPAKLSHAYSIAHELEHLIADLSGFPGVGSEAQYENLASSLTSIVADLIVDAALEQFGFDFRKHCEAELAESLRQLKNGAVLPIDRYGQFHWVCNYASQITSAELAKIDPGANEFQNWFDTEYPVIAHRGQQLVKMIKRIGYDTPDKQTRLFKEIIERYRFGKILKVI